MGLKILLLAQTLLLLIYTAIVGMNNGWDIAGVFVQNLVSMSWNGQFSLDFSCYLLLSALWIMWRNRFSAWAIVWACIAAVMGIIVFAPYLLFLTIQEKGDINKVLLGDRKL
ncbi:MAG: hypothetical protein EAZ55_00740 [Cytophagales bacterium]|nr:MAG: hypothetical protein EAZ55_00740 [Cytophagales bacterium]